MSQRAAYYSDLFRIALPIIAQNFLTSSLGLVGSMLIGQLGEVAVAAVGLANQVTFILILMLFGVASGCAIFSAQFWGRNDIASIHKVLGLSLGVSMLAGGLFFILSSVFPQQMIGIYTSDPAVIELGGRYLQAAALSFLFMPFSFSYSSILRSIGEVRIPLAASILALVVNVGASYLLIFGGLGLPAMGALGGAVAVVISRFVEALFQLGVTYARRLAPAANLRQLLSFNLAFAQQVMARALPVAANETFWSLGVSAYNIIYARMSTEAVAAVNIAANIDGLVIMIFFGIADATGILVGNRIGAGKEQEAFDYARRSLVISALGALMMGGVIYALSGPLLSIYKVSPQVIVFANHIMFVVACTLWIRSSNLMLLLGILRAGGDTRFGFLLDTLSIWLVGVPLAALGAFVLQLPVYLVYLMVMVEELVKFGAAMRRFLSRRWINNLAQTAALPDIEPGLLPGV